MPNRNIFTINDLDRLGRSLASFEKGGLTSDDRYVNGLEFYHFVQSGLGRKELKERVAQQGKYLEKKYKYETLGNDPRGITDIVKKLPDGKEISAYEAFALHKLQELVHANELEESLRVSGIEQSTRKIIFIIETLIRLVALPGLDKNLAGIGRIGAGDFGRASREGTNPEPNSQKTSNQKPSGDGAKTSNPKTPGEDRKPSDGNSLAKAPHFNSFSSGQSNVSPPSHLATQAGLTAQKNGGGRTGHALEQNGVGKSSTHTKTVSSSHTITQPIGVTADDVATFLNGGGTTFPANWKRDVNGKIILRPIEKTLEFRKFFSDGRIYKPISVIFFDNVAGRLNPADFSYPSNFPIVFDNCTNVAGITITPENQPSALILSNSKIENLSVNNCALKTLIVEDGSTIGKLELSDATLGNFYCANDVPVQAKDASDDGKFFPKMEGGDGSNQKKIPTISEITVTGNSEIVVPMDGRPYWSGRGKIPAGTKLSIIGNPSRKFVVQEQITSDELTEFLGKCGASLQEKQNLAKTTLERTQGIPLVIQGCGPEAETEIRRALGYYLGVEDPSQVDISKFTGDFTDYQPLIRAFEPLLSKSGIEIFDAANRPSAPHVNISVCSLNMTALAETLNLPVGNDLTAETFPFGGYDLGHCTVLLNDGFGESLTGIVMIERMENGVKVTKSIPLDAAAKKALGRLFNIPANEMTDATLLSKLIAYGVGKLTVSSELSQSVSRSPSERRGSASASTSDTSERSESASSEMTETESEEGSVSRSVSATSEETRTGSKSESASLDGTVTESDSASLDDTRTESEEGSVSRSTSATSERSASASPRGTRTETESGEKPASRSNSPTSQKTKSGSTEHKKTVTRSEEERSTSDSKSAFISRTKTKSEAIKIKFEANKKSELSAGEIAGIVSAAVIAIAVGLAGAFKCVSSLRRNASETNEIPDHRRSRHRPHPLDRGEGRAVIIEVTSSEELGEQPIEQQPTETATAVAYQEPPRSPSGSLERPERSTTPRTKTSLDHPQF